MEHTNSITITDPTIVSFYRENTHLNVVSMNLVFIDILKNLSSNLSNTINDTINYKILSIVSDIDKSISTFKSDIILSFNEKLLQTKREYIEDLKFQLLSNNEKVSSIIDKNTDTILTKTTSIINDIIPKSQDKNYIQIESCIKSFCSSIEQDTKKLLETKNKDDNSTKIIIDNIESTFSKMASSIQNPLSNLIQSSEERTSQGIQKVKDEFTQQQIIQEKLSNELNDFLNKYKNNSTIKGGVSENELYFMLQSIMPCDEIVRVSTETASCDFKVNRKNKDKPTILFENKDYNKNVTTDEVKKFERDLQLQKYHGIFISQKTPITFKDSFQIDIINGLIHIYIPNANYDTDKLKVAIDIIDSLSSKLVVINNNNNDDGDFSINKKDIEELTDEFRNFAMQKLSIIETVKLMSKQLLDKLEDMQLPKIKSLLVKYGIIENECFNCCYCNYQAKNKASLSAHSRNCKTNPNPKNKKEDTIDPIIELLIPENLTIEIETNLNKEVVEKIEIKPIDTEVGKKNKSKKIPT